MKIGLYADPHVSQTSSIIVGKQGEFSGRLNNLIQSFKWMSQIFKEKQCQVIICLGDMTDKSSLTSEEITAMSQFEGIREHLLLVGNHCRSDKSGKINSLNLVNNSIFKPCVETFGGRKFLFLPYNTSLEDLSLYKDIDVILSHNDIKGYDLGGHTSTEGYEISTITDHCQLFINGHLHNGGWLVNNRVVNLGQLSGMNFSSCGGQWEPSIGILDTETLNLEIIENPYAYRFKKETFDTLVKLRNYIKSLPSIGRYVLQVKVPSNIVDSARSILTKSEKVEAFRLLVLKSEKIKTPKTRESQESFENKNIYTKLREFISTKSQTKYDSDIATSIIDEIEKKEGVV